MTNHETVRPLTSGEILDFGAAILQQFPRNASPDTVRHFLCHKKELGQVLNKLCGKVLIGDVVNVDRSATVIHPDWVKESLYPELEATGPSDFTLDSLQQWLHPTQETWSAAGNFLHEYLRKNGMLESCLGLAELLAIQKLGVDVFRRHFAGKVVYGWKSVVRGRDGDLNVPCLIETTGDGVILYWYSLGRDFRSREPVLRFGK